MGGKKKTLSKTSHFKFFKMVKVKKKQTLHGIFTLSFGFLFYFFFVIILYFIIFFFFTVAIRYLHKMYFLNHQKKIFSTLFGLFGSIELVFHASFILFI